MFRRARRRAARGCSAALSSHGIDGRRFELIASHCRYGESGILSSPSLPFVPGRLYSRFPDICALYGARERENKGVLYGRWTVPFWLEQISRPIEGAGSCDVAAAPGQLADGERVAKASAVSYRSVRRGGPIVQIPACTRNGRGSVGGALRVRSSGQRCDEGSARSAPRPKQRPILCPGARCAVTQRSASIRLAIVH